MVSSSRDIMVTMPPHSRCKLYTRLPTVTHTHMYIGHCIVSPDLVTDTLLCVFYGNLPFVLRVTVKKPQPSPRPQQNITCAPSISGGATLRAVNALLLTLLILLAPASLWTHHGRRRQASKGRHHPRNTRKDRKQARKVGGGETGRCGLLW